MQNYILRQDGLLSVKEQRREWERVLVFMVMRQKRPKD
jgi:hypothetical protein